MDCNLKTSGDSDNKIVVFASVPEKKDLCCIIAYINSEEKIDKSAKSMFHWQILKCRQIIFTEPEIIASPVMGAENQIYIIMDREYHDCGKIQIQLEKLKLLAFESTAVTNSIYEACLRYTLIARIAPLWNQVENYLIQGRDFLSATSPANAIKMDIGINDGEMFVLLWPTKVRLPLLKFEDLDVPTQISQDFISHSTGFISETALGSQWIHVLPSLKRGRLISVSHEIPDNCPFRTYKELKRHWKNLYGYRLPEDAENRVYYTLHFHPLSPTFYTYPDVCVRPQGLMFLRRVDQLGVLKAFLSDLTKKLPTVCGQPFAINPKVAYAVPKLQKLNERTVLHIFRRKSQLFTRETSPIIINGHCLPEDDENRVYYTLHFYPLSPTFYTYPDVCVQPQGLMFLRHVDQLGVLKAFRSNFTKKLPTVCGQPFAFNPKVAYAVPKLHKLNEVPDLARANLTSSPYLKTNKNLIPIEPTFITSPTNDYQMEYNVINSLSSQNDMFASQTTASLCSRNLSLMTPSESTSRDERSNIPTALPGSTPAYMQYSLLCRRASPSNPDPGKPQPRYVPIFKRKYLPSQYCNQNNQPVSSAVGHVTEVTRSGQIYKPTFGHSVISEAMSQNMKYGTSPSRQVYKTMTPAVPPLKLKIVSCNLPLLREVNFKRDGECSTTNDKGMGAKKVRTRPQVQTDIDVEELARNHDLARVNTTTLVNWLREKLVPCKVKDKKSDLVDKVMNYLNLSK